MDEFWTDLVRRVPRRGRPRSTPPAAATSSSTTSSFAYLCDADFRDQMTARGDDPDDLIVKHRDAMNAVLADRPDDLLGDDAHVPR